MCKAFFVWSLTTRGRYAPAVYFDDPPGTAGLKNTAEEFRSILHPILDPELLALVNETDGGCFAALAARYPHPAIPPREILCKIEAETHA